MTYNPSIPQPTDNLSNSQADMLTNFTQLNTLFANDHYTWNDATSARRGYHRQVTFYTPDGATSLASGTQSKAYAVNSAGTGNLSELFFANSTKNTQITLNGKEIWKGGPGTGTGEVVGTIASNGYMQLPNGLIFQWGTKASTGSTTSITFAIPFPNALFSLSAIRRSSSTEYGYSNPSLSGFDFVANSSSTGVGIFWSAIGN